VECEEAGRKGREDGRTRIVVLDEVDPSGSQRTRLSDLGEVRWSGDDPGGVDEILERLRDCETAVLGWTSLDSEILDLLPDPRMISVRVTGYDHVDVGAVAERGVVVTNVPSYAGVAVAEFTLGAMISLLRRVPDARNSLREGRGPRRPFRGTESRNRALGVVGTGDIGGNVARTGAALGTRAVATGRRTDPAGAAELGVSHEPLTGLLSSAVVSLHVPLTTETRGPMGPAELELMGSGPYLINTTRADVVDQEALERTPRTGGPARAVPDEVHLPDDEPLGMPNVIVTPHRGTARRRL